MGEERLEFAFFKLLDVKVAKGKDADDEEDEGDIRVDGEGLGV